MGDVTIITGEIDSGKTSKMQEIYASEKSGDGFLCVKRYSNYIHTGYDLLFLSEGRTVPFIRKREYLQNSEKTVFSTVKYVFIEKAFSQADMLIYRLVREGTSPVFIDELGPLELEKKCFYKSALSVIQNNIDLIASVRKSCLNEMILLLDISRYRIIEV